MNKYIILPILIVVSLWTSGFSQPEKAYLDQQTLEAVDLTRTSYYTSMFSTAKDALFGGLKTKDFEEFLSQDILVIDIDEDTAHAAILNAKMGFDELQSITIMAEPTVRSPTAIISRFQGEQYDVILVSQDSSHVYPKKASDEFGTDKPAYIENRRRILLRGIDVWQGLTGHEIQYPLVALDYSSIPRVILQRGSEDSIEILSIPYELPRDSEDREKVREWVQKVIYWLIDQDIYPYALFLVDRKGEVVSKHSLEGDASYDDEFDIDLIYLLGGLQTATSLHHLLPAEQVLYFKEWRPLTEYELSLRRLRYAYELNKGSRFCTDKHLNIRSPYWLEAINIPGMAFFHEDQVKRIWLKYAKTDLQLAEYAQLKHHEWEEAGSPLTFPEWLVNEVWEEQHPADTLDEWTLQLKWEKSDMVKPLADWKAWYLRSLEKDWDKNPLGLTLEEYIALDMSRERANTTYDIAGWQRVLRWREEGSPGDFATWAMTKDWEKASKESQTKMTLQEWIDDQLDLDRRRWESQGFKDLGMPLDIYRQQQGIFPYYGDQPNAAGRSAQKYGERSLTLLSAKERKDWYRVTLKDGHIYRGDRPYSSELDKTRSGMGYAVYVVDCEGNLYVAAHLPLFFHHSAFMADGATFAAGELKTDANGKIIFLTNRTGHYSPTNAEAIRALYYFADHGVNLYEAAFGHRGYGPHVDYDSAQQYIDIAK